MMARNTIPIVGLSGVLWLFGTVPGFAGEQTHQAGTPDKPLARLMQQYREKQDITIDDKELVKTFGGDLIAPLKRYLQDPSERVHWRPCSLLWRLGTNPPR